MNQSPTPSNKPGPAPYVNGMAMMGVGGQVGCITLLIVFVALFGGLALDRILGTKPIFTIILLLGSAPLALYLTFQVAMRSIKKMAPPVPPTGAQARPQNEEDDRD